MEPCSASGAAELLPLHVDLGNSSDFRPDFRPEVASHRNTGPVMGNTRLLFRFAYGTPLGRRTQALQLIRFREHRPVIISLITPRLCETTPPVL